MAQRAGRLTCPKCGANNFDTVTSCWKCGTPMGAGGAAMAAMPMSAPAAPAYVERAPQSSPQMAYAPPASAPIPTGDSRMARRAAIALALTIPWIGLPVGWIFMMIEDRSKQSVGRVCANWSIAALIVHLVLMFWATQATMSLLQTYATPLVKGYMQGMQNRGAREEGGAAIP